MIRLVLLSCVWTKFLHILIDSSRFSRLRFCFFRFHISDIIDKRLYQSTTVSPLSFQCVFIKLQRLFLLILLLASLLNHTEWSYTDLFFPEVTGLTGTWRHHNCLDSSHFTTYSIKWAWGWWWRRGGWRWILVYYHIHKQLLIELVATFQTTARWFFHFSLSLHESSSAPARPTTLLAKGSRHCLVNQEALAAFTLFSYLIKSRCDLN